MKTEQEEIDFYLECITSEPMLIGVISKRINKKLGLKGQDRISQLAILTVCEALTDKGILIKNTQDLEIKNSKILDDGIYNISTYATKVNYFRL